MVFRGRPSAACLACRQRRIRCDRDPVCCGSCKRLGIACTGYRDTQGARFCDETKQVVGKYYSSNRQDREAASPKNQRRTFNLNVSCKAENAEECSFKLQPFAYSLGPSLDDFALSFCCGRIGYYQCSLGIIAHSISDDQQLLPECLKALGLATCAIVKSSTDFSIDAKRYYLSALAKTNTALATSDRARSDSTLLSVMVLSNIETIFGSNPQSFEAWSAHINGSTALLKVRGEEQLKTVNGRLLFMQASTNIVSNCIRNVARVPAYLHTLTEAAAPYLSAASHDAVVWAIHRARLTLADLCSEVVSGGEWTTTDTIVRGAQDLDQYLLEVFERGPPHPCSRSDNGAGDHDPFPDLDHPLVVRNFWASQCWVSMLVVRLILHLLLSALLNSKDTPTVWQADLEKSGKLLSILQQDILDLVGYQISLAKGELGLDATSARAATMSRLISAQAGVSNAVSAMADHLLVESLSRSTTLSFRQDVPVLRLSRGYNVISPLLLVSQVASPDSGHLESACRLLRLAGETMGIQQALVLAKQLQVVCSC